MTSYSTSEVHIVISKLTGHIMAVYIDLALAKELWNDKYNILTLPISRRN